MWWRVVVKDDWSYGICTVGSLEDELPKWMAKVKRLQYRVGIAVEHYTMQGQRRPWSIT